MAIFPEDGHMSGRKNIGLKGRQIITPAGGHTYLGPTQAITENPHTSSWLDN
jgi:hypothetical protein